MGPLFNLVTYVLVFLILVVLVVVFALPALAISAAVGIGYYVWSARKGRPRAARAVGVALLMVGIQALVIPVLFYVALFIAGLLMVW